MATIEFNPLAIKEAYRDIFQYYLEKEQGLEVLNYTCNPFGNQALWAFHINNPIGYFTPNHLNIILEELLDESEGVTGSWSSFGYQIEDLFDEPQKSIGYTTYLYIITE